MNNSTGSGTGSAAVLVKSGAILAGNGIIGGATTIEDEATLAPGTGAGARSPLPATSAWAIIRCCNSNWAATATGSS